MSQTESKELMFHPWVIKLMEHKYGFVLMSLPDGYLLLLGQWRSDAD